MNPPTIDVILHHYRARPGNFAHLPFGEWFVKAHAIVDTDLRSSQSIAEAKRLIRVKCYDVLDITPLVEFNKRLEAQ